MVIYASSELEDMINSRKDKKQAGPFSFSVLKIGCTVFYKITWISTNSVKQGEYAPRDFLAVH